MRYMGTVMVPDSPGQVGTSLPEGARVVHIETRTPGFVTLHYLADVDSKWSESDIAIAWSGMHVTPDMEYVGTFRRADDRLSYVFVRRN